MTNTNDEYWKDYSNLQYVKHQLIKHYLDGWLPKLGFWSGKILYFDTHAGRGRHMRDQLGSPLIALHTLLDHSFRATLLKSCEAHFFFIERDKENLEALRKELHQVGPLPSGIKVHTSGDNCFDELNSLIEYFGEPGRNLAPAFIFVDPYGFKVPGEILRKLMEFPRVELFVNIIWRELNMAICQGHEKKGMADTLNLVFDGTSWKRLTEIDDLNLRAETAVNLIRKMTAARWATWITMRGANNVARYLLVHLSNHDAGRDLMKDCIWKVCPDGGFYARKTDDPTQQYLITPSPNLTPLKQWVIGNLTEHPQRWEELKEKVRSEIWRTAHLNKVIKELQKNRVIRGDDYDGRFAATNNPLLILVDNS